MGVTISCLKISGQQPSLIAEFIRLFIGFANLSEKTFRSLAGMSPFTFDLFASISLKIRLTSFSENFGMSSSLKTGTFIHLLLPKICLQLAQLVQILEDLL